MSRYEELVQRWDKLEAAQAVARAWQDPGPRHGTWHKRAREELAYSMPILARHLDRLLTELEVIGRAFEVSNRKTPRPVLRCKRVGP